MVISFSSSYKVVEQIYYADLEKYEIIDKCQLKRREGCSPQEITESVLKCLRHHSFDVMRDDQVTLKEKKIVIQVYKKIIK